MIIQNPKKGFIETKQFLIYIVRQNVFIPRDLVKVAQKAPRIVVPIAPSDNVSSRWLGHPLHLHLAKILKLPRLHTSFHPLNSSLESNALLFSTIIRSSVPRLLLISENYFHGLLNARSHERLSQLQRCQLEYLMNYFGLHHTVSLVSFADRSIV